MRWYDVNEEEKFIKKHFKEAKKVIDEANGIDATEQQVREVLHFLKSMAEISLEQMEKDFELAKRLKAEPGGFLMEADYGPGCCICGSPRGEVDRWYDKNGIKCMYCQRAVEQKLIPVNVATDRESYYSEQDLSKYFNLNGKVLTEWINGKLLTCRVIKNSKGGRHCRIFLMKENKGFLPPKKMLEKAAGDSGDHWYHCVAPFDYLKKYGIIAHMRPVEPVAQQAEPPVPETAEPLPEIPDVPLCQPCTFPVGMARVPKRKAKRRK